jgi:hypothetical protein
MIKTTCCLALTLVLIPIPTWAQGSVTIFGTVAHASGSIVPGVTVTATNTQTALTRVVVSDANGTYTIGQLPPGVYTVKAELSGFKIFLLERVQTQVDENRRVNIVMELGQLAERDGDRRNGASRYPIGDAARSRGPAADRRAALEWPKPPPITVTAPRRRRGGTGGSGPGWPRLRVRPSSHPHRLQAAANQGARPRNIVVVLTDDHRYDALGFMNHPFLETPNLDSLRESSNWR